MVAHEALVHLARRSAPAPSRTAGSGAICSTFRSVTRRRSFTPTSKAIAVVGGDHDHRLVEEAGLAEPREQQPHLVVHVAHLKQVARLVVVRQRLVVEAHRPVDRRGSGRCPSACSDARRAGRSRARAAAGHAGGRRSAPRACGSPRSKRGAAAGRPPPASRFSTPGPRGARVGADAGRAERLARLHVHHVVAEAVEEVVDAARVAAEVGCRAASAEAPSP